MPLNIQTRASASPAAGLLSRLLERCARLLPHVVLPGYFPISHAYHFPAKEPAASPHASHKKISRAPAAPFRR